MSSSSGFECFLRCEEIICKGSFGSIYTGVWHCNELHEINVLKKVALKVMAYGNDEILTISKELSFLKIINSPFIVKYLNNFTYKMSELWVLMDISDCICLFDICCSLSASFTEIELKALLACVSLGLAYINSQRGIHGDIRAGNILLTTSGCAKLSDFDLSTKFIRTNNTEFRRNTVIGTPYWMAPEILLESSCKFFLPLLI